LKKDKILSRGPDIDTQKCVRMVGDNKFVLVLVASQKARELRRHNHDDHGCVSALLEIQQGRVDTQEYLNKRVKVRQPKR
jgi:DNA-directed RNA polymerase subunit K/omega